MNINTSRFEKSSADPRMWENDRHERVFILGQNMRDVRASKSLLTPMIVQVVTAHAMGKREVEVTETRGF